MRRTGQALSHPLVVLGLVLAVLPWLLPAVGSTVSLATEIAIYSLYGIGYNLLLGYTGLTSFGASAYFGAAGYAAGLFEIHLLPSVWASVLAGTAFAALSALVLGFLILRRRGLYFALLTLAFTQLLFEIAFHWTEVTGGENGLQGVTRPGLDDPLVFHFFTVGCVAGSSYLIWRMVHSPFGRVLQAIRDNEERVRCLGYNAERYKLAAFVLSSTFMGLAGSLLTFLIRGAYADNLGWQHAGDPVVMTVLGGMHHFLGPMWGALVFLLLSDQLSSYTEHWWLAFGALVIVFVLLSPEGLSGIYAHLRRRQGWRLTQARLPARLPGALPAYDAAASEQDRSEPILSVRGLTKRFGALVAADAVDLALWPREVHGLIGPNGAGKTTLFNQLTGLVASDAGEIFFQGRAIGRMPVHRRARAGLGRCFQIISIFKDLSVFENVRIAVQARAPRRVSLWHDAYAAPEVAATTYALLEAVELDRHAGERAGNLSHGEQRLLEIAVTLGAAPQALLLDEPFAGLAEAERERVGALIRQLARRHSVLLIEHDIDRVLALSDRVTVLHLGRVIAEGAPSEVAGHPEVATAYLGRDIQAVRPALARRSITMSRPKALIELQDLEAGYHGSRVLHGVSLRVGDGTMVALLGRNGVGKTTTLHTIMGAVKPSGGAIRFAGAAITGLRPDRVNHLGISIVPEGRRIFPNLTVRDNLVLAQRPGGWEIDRAWQLFPRLGELQRARGETLSGGERQMLAIARALMAPTRLLLLDEPLEGLAPRVVGEVLEAIARLREHTSILIVDQKVDLVLELADYAYVMVNGRVSYEGEASALRRDEPLKQRLLSV
jgi:ABC-type branched-subunit amino acid transport system ATPase component/ABC-type branched-subunit amino acid transport system permease subunit